MNAGRHSRDGWRDGRLDAWRDAAAAVHLNTSVRDAYHLGWKLGQVLRHGAPAALSTDSTEEERRPIAADMLGLSTRHAAGGRHGHRTHGIRRRLGPLAPLGIL
ncbi:FAD-dependent monooxygenase [Streptomyces sp. NPDC056638]|uniref:FAD-dependent monooxygenase n=1 Tax=Streptomyces sp. NPDC056638 TaxID=3345887 RepID=UPI00367486D3